MAQKHNDIQPQAEPYIVKLHDIQTQTMRIG